MFNKKKEPQGEVLSIPHDYSFEFTVKHNVPSTFDADSLIAGVSWDLFYKNKQVDQGVHNFWMTEDRIEQRMFMLAHKAVKKHNKKITGSETFPYTEGPIHELPHVMYIDADLLKKY